MHPRSDLFIPDLGYSSPIWDIHPRSDLLIPGLGYSSPIWDIHPRSDLLIPDLGYLSPTRDSYPRSGVFIPLALPDQHCHANTAQPTFYVSIATTTVHQHLDQHCLASIAGPASAGLALPGQDCLASIARAALPCRASIAGPAVLGPHCGVSIADSPLDITGGALTCRAREKIARARIAWPALPGPPCHAGPASLGQQCWARIAGPALRGQHCRTSSARPAFLALLRRHAWLVSLGQLCFGSIDSASIAE